LTRPEKTRFDECVLDAGSRQLLRRGEPVHLSRKAFDLLELLIDTRPRVLSKADLFDRLWPKTVVVDANLSNLIAEIRAAIGDEPRKPQLVRTVHGFGYAFIGQVRSEPAQSEDATHDSLSWLRFDERKLHLGQGDHLIGRHPASIVPIDAATVSRHHAVIRVRGVDAVLEDLGSRNGTAVNGEKIGGPYLLRNGDRINLGSVTMSYWVSSLAPSTAAVKAPGITGTVAAQGLAARATPGGETTVGRPPSRARRQ